MFFAAPCSNASTPPGCCRILAEADIDDLLPRVRCRKLLSFWNDGVEVRDGAGVANAVFAGLLPVYLKIRVTPPAASKWSLRYRASSTNVWGRWGAGGVGYFNINCSATE
jgi:hypothetical protein